MNEFVYLVRFRDHKNCYKVGSTYDPFSRLSQLYTMYKDVDMVLFGEAPDKLKAEREIQFKLNNYSNRHLFLCENAKRRGWSLSQVGSDKSQEHFVLNNVAFLIALDAFRESCETLYGPSFRKIKVPT
jgi:hypothetical protein